MDKLFAVIPYVNSPDAKNRTHATEIATPATENFSGVAPQPLKSSVAEEHKSGPNDRYFNRIQIFVCTARIPSALRVHVGCLNAKARPPAPLNIHLQRQDSAAPLKFHTRATAPLHE